eukprot:scaffold142203_cov19-Tisochrysis_lutea.AAC.1
MKVCLWTPSWCCARMTGCCGCCCWFVPWLLHPLMPPLDPVAGPLPPPGSCFVHLSHLTSSAGPPATTQGSRSTPQPRPSQLRLIPHSHRHIY